jgi:hypothetical protein
MSRNCMLDELNEWILYVRRSFFSIDSELSEMTIILQYLFLYIITTTTTTLPFGM